MQDLLRCYGDEKEARIAVESSRNELSEELNRVKLDQKRLNDQVLLLFSIFSYPFLCMNICFTCILYHLDQDAPRYKQEASRIQH